MNIFSCYASIIVLNFIISYFYYQYTMCTSITEMFLLCKCVNLRIQYKLLSKSLRPFNKNYQDHTCSLPSNNEDKKYKNRSDKLAVLYVQD